MANASAAAANTSVVPKAVHVGNQSVMGSINYTTALSAGDAFAMCKLPKYARIVDIQVQGAVVGTSAGINIGDAGSSTRHGKVSITSTSTGSLRPTNIQYGHTYLSAGDSANEWLIYAGVEGAVSNSGGASLNVIVTYCMDGLSPALQGAN